MTAPARFKQSDIRRALKAADNLGFEEVRVVIGPNGQIEVIAKRTATEEMGVELD